MSLFIKHRLSKLLLPNAFVMAVFIIVYWLIGADLTDISQEILEKAKVNLMFGELGSHKATLFDCLSCFVGVKSINGALWYVGVTAYHYLAFCLVKTIFDIRKQRVRLLIAYTLLLAMFGCMAYILDASIHYWCYLWVLVVGLSLAVYERELLTRGIWYKIVMWMGVSVVAFLFIKLTRVGNARYYVLGVNAGFLVLCATNFLFSRYNLIKRSSIAWLGGLSYFIYLVHDYILPIEWWAIDYVSLSLTIASSILIAYILSLSYSQIEKAIKMYAKSAMLYVQRRKNCRF